MSNLESEWLQRVTSLSLESSSNPPPPGHDNIVYSRKLVPTYNYVVLAFIALYSVAHWSHKIVYWRRRRSSKVRKVNREEAIDAETSRTSLETNNQDIKDIYSSSSSTANSTINLSVNNSNGAEDEESPLIHHRQASQSSWKSRWSAIQALWMYQPPPIPVVNKVLPSNGASFLVLIFVALNLFYTFHRMSFEFSELFILADRASLVFVVNLPLLYLLAAKNQPLKVLTGRSYESLNIFHRRLGEILCLEALLHAVGMLGAWYHFLRPVGFGLVKFLSSKIILLGMGAFLSYETLYFTSLASLRAKWYELFLLSHIFLQIAGLVFLYFHHAFAQWYVLAASAIFLVDRLVYRLGMKGTKIEAITKILEDEDTVRLSAIIPCQPSSFFSKIFGSTLQNGWKATDHIFLSVSSLSGRHIMQAHPFTIASAPPHPDAQGGILDLLIRAQDGFSRDLLNAARLHKHLDISLDGPYGSSHVRDMLESSDLAILVAGGSGIAVCWPLVHHLIQAQAQVQSNQSSSSFSSPAHTSFDIESRRRNINYIPFASRKQKVILIWIIHESTHLSWLGRPALQDADNQGVEIIIPRATEEVGRPDLKRIIHEIVYTYARRKQDGKRVRVVASGPDGMGRAVRNTCAGLVREGHNVDICVEKFGW